MYCFDRAKTLIIAVGLFAISTVASEAIMITSVDRATFATAVIGGTISGENFDSQTDGAVAVTPGVTYSSSQGAVLITNDFLTTTNPNGIGAARASPFKFFEIGSTATFTFVSAITAFAIDINTFATADGAYTATLDTGDVVSSIFATFPSFATGQFIGFISDTAFSSITIADTGFSYTLDTLVYGDAGAVVSPVPLPAAFPLFAGGLGIMGFIGWRKKRKIAATA